MTLLTLRSVVCPRIPSSLLGTLASFSLGKKNLFGNEPYFTILAGIGDALYLNY